MHPVDAFLLTVSIVFIPVGLFVWFMAHRERLEDEAAEGHDIPAE